jgi:hypothetical protein
MQSQLANSDRWLEHSFSRFETLNENVYIFKPLSDQMPLGIFPAMPVLSAEFTNERRIMTVRRIRLFDRRRSDYLVTYALRRTDSAILGGHDRNYQPGQHEVD